MRGGRFWGALLLVQTASNAKEKAMVGFVSEVCVRMRDR